MASLGRLLCMLCLFWCGAGSLENSVLPFNTASKKPIIGIIMQRCHHKAMKKLGNYYIAASYVKYLESAGARVAPIRIDLTKEEYEKIFKSINGILFPGGGANIKKSNYSHVSKIFYKLAIQICYKAKGKNFTTPHFSSASASGAHKDSEIRYLSDMSIIASVIFNTVRSFSNKTDKRLLPATSNFAEKLKLAHMESFDDGDYFPVWGTCLGFEELSFLTSGEFLLTPTNTTGLKLPLNFTEAILQSRMFENFPAELLLSLAVEPLTANFHKWSLSMKNFSKNEKLSKFYNVLTTNSDGKVEFISTMEAYHYPIYGVQWHPEKPPYEWKKLEGISHTPNAVKAAFYLAEFFVSEARKNNHRFASPTEESKHLIYQFHPVYTGNFSSFQQVYIFN